MQDSRQAQTLIDLENRFWQSMVDEDTDTALGLLCEPAVMVSEHGTMQFDHDGYRQMAERGSMVLKSYDLQDVKVLFPNDDTAVMTYRVRQSMAMRGKPDATEQLMADSSTWVRDGDRWRCAMHTETPLQQQSH